MIAQAVDHAQVLDGAGDLLAGFGRGIEADATLIEIRLALALYRSLPDRPDWRVHLPTRGRA